MIKHFIMINTHVRIILTKNTIQTPLFHLLDEPHPRVQRAIPSSALRHTYTCSLNMLEAFDVIKLVEKLPLKICAIATWGE